MLGRKKILIPIAAALGVALVTFLTIVIIKNVTSLNDSDRAKLNEFTSKALIYLDEFDSEEEGLNENTRMAIFATAYNYGENDKTELSLDEAKQIVKDIFNKNLEEPEGDMQTTGEAKLNKYVKYNPTEKKLALDRSTINKRTVTEIPLWFYQEKDAKKYGKSFVVKYQKYKTANPYDIFNYAAVNQKEIPELAGYLQGNGSYAPIKRAISNDEISSVGQYVKDLTVTYKYSGDNLYIDSIK